MAAGMTQVHAGVAAALADLDADDGRATLLVVTDAVDPTAASRAITLPVRR